MQAKGRQGAFPSENGTTMEIFMIWLVFAVLTAVIASTKGRNVASWAAIGFVTGLFGLIAVCAMPAVTQEESATS
jgi:hypothetical protein